MTTVSSAVVALAFIGQASKIGFSFYVFALVLLPALFVMGLSTFLRVLQTSIEDTFYARGINRIRHYYLEIAPQARPYLLLSTNDDMKGVLYNMGIRPSRLQLLLATPSLIAFMNSLLLGIFVAMGVSVGLKWSVIICTVIGIIAAIFIFMLHYRYQRKAWKIAEAHQEVLFPSEGK